MTAAADAYAVPRPERWYEPPDLVDVAGTQVAVRRHGSGPTVLYVHGHWLSRRWLPFHQALAVRTDVIAPDLPGFGESPKPPWLTGRDDVVLVLRALLETLRTGPVHLVGHGLGAWIAADTAIWCPERVASLSLVAPYGLRVPGEPLANVFLMNPDAYAERYFGGDAAPFADAVPGAGTPAAPGGAEEYAQRYGEMGTAAVLMWERRYDLKLEHRLPRLGRPALVVEAGADRIVPPAHTSRWAELLGAARVTVPGAPHALVLTEPERTADAVATFIEGVSR